MLFIAGPASMSPFTGTALSDPLFYRMISANERTATHLSVIIRDRRRDLQIKIAAVR